MIRSNLVILLRNMKLIPRIISSHTLALVLIVVSSGVQAQTINGNQPLPENSTENTLQKKVPDNSQNPCRIVNINQCTGETESILTVNKKSGETDLLYSRRKNFSYKKK